MTAIVALANEAGADVTLAETVIDDREATREAFGRALEGADIVVSSGGEVESTGGTCAGCRCGRAGSRSAAGRCVCSRSRAASSRCTARFPTR